MRPMILQPASLPATCYVGEIAYWLAFGRVPPDFFGDYDGSERENRASFLERGGAIEHDFYGFSQSEFAINGIVVDDWDRYFRAKDRSFGNATGAEHIAYIERQLDLVLAGHNEEQKQALRERVLTEAADIDWARSFDSQLWPLVVAARAEVFLSLSRGEIEARGWPDGEADDEALALFPVPAKAWTLAGINWTTSKLTCSAPTGTFNAVQVRMDDVLRRFPKPHHLVTTQMVSFYSDCGLVTEEQLMDVADGGSAPRARLVSGPQKRGRPPNGNYSVRQLVENYFRGQVPPAGAELSKALIAEVQAFIERACGETVPRSTVLDHLNHARRATAAAGVKS